MMILILLIKDPSRSRTKIFQSRADRTPRKQLYFYLKTSNFSRRLALSVISTRLVLFRLNRKAMLKQQPLSDFKFYSNKYLIIDNDRVMIPALKTWMKSCLKLEKWQWLLEKILLKSVVQVPLSPNIWLIDRQPTSGPQTSGLILFAEELIINSNITLSSFDKNQFGLLF